MIEIENKYNGRDIRQVIIDCINKHGVIGAAAHELGLRHEVLTRWCNRLGIERITRRKTIAQTIARLRE